MVYTFDHGILPTPSQRIAHVITKFKFAYLLPIGASGMALFWIGLLLAIIAIHPAENIQVPPPKVLTVRISTSSRQNALPINTSASMIPVVVSNPHPQHIVVVSQ